MDTEPRSLDKAIFAGLSFALTLALLIGTYALMTRQSSSTTVSILPPLPTATLTPTETPLPTNTPSPLEIYVVGAVQNSEARLNLTAGSRVEDAIEAAGGALDSADLSKVNLAQRLQDGDMIFVPTLVGEGDTTAVSENADYTPTPNAPRLVNINTGTLEELQTLPGIGPARAQDIIDYREANGPFQSVEDLDNVSGIGPATIEELRPLIVLED